MYRTLNIIDEFTREALAIRVDRKLDSIDVVGVNLSTHLPFSLGSDRGIANFKWLT